MKKIIIFERVLVGSVFRVVDEIRVNEGEREREGDSRSVRSVGRLLDVLQS